MGERASRDKVNERLPRLHHSPKGGRKYGAADGAIGLVHHGFNGAYLKACVNYLLITGEPFKATVAECGIEPEKAAYLQKVAEEVVLKR